MASAKDIAEVEKSLPEIILSEDQTISDSAIRAVGQAATLWKRAKGEMIVRQDELCDRWIFVAKGLCRILFARGKNTSTLFFDGGGAIFTSFHALVRGEAGVFGVEALTDSYGWEISHEKYRQLTSEYPELLRFELSFLHHQLYCLEDRYARYALLSSEERYKRFWQQWSLVNERTTSEMTKYIPLKIIAQYLSMTQQNLSMLRHKELDSLRKQQKNTPSE